MLKFVIMMTLTFGISWFNAYQVGKSWADSKIMGGFTRIIAWCGAIMAACGFSWVYLAIISWVAARYFNMPSKFVLALYNMGYLALIIPTIGSGLGIMIHSWVVAWRNKSFGSVGVALWNSYAQIYNTYHAFSGIGRALSGVTSILGDDDEEGWMKYVFMLLLSAIAGGVLTTAVIVKRTAKQNATNMLGWMEANKNLVRA